MYTEGICLSMIEEFDQVLSTGKPYSILPLGRLSESSGVVAQSLTDHSHETLASLTSLADNMLRRVADMPTTTEEVITRVGLRVDTVDDAGNRPLCRPVNQSKVALSEATNKGAKVCMRYVILIIFMLTHIFMSAEAFKG